jgi:hypothetical protein
MQLHHFKATLAKISQLFSTIETDNGQVSAIEKDLMLSYIRQLYDAALTNTPLEMTKAPIPTPPPPVVVPPIPAVVAPPVVVVPPTVVEPVVVPPAPVIEKIKLPDIPFEIEKTHIEPTTPKIEPPVYVAPPKVEPPRQEPPKITIAPIKSTPIINMTVPGAKKPLIDAAQEEPEGFFGEKMSKELSDKLGETPIDDMRKGMGLNERILLMNELFDGDQRGFEDTINTVNSMNSFDEAKNYLLSIIAPKYNWASKEKRAKSFAKVVRRRFAK